MKALTRALFWLFLLAYLGALDVFAIGTFGWLDQARDPLSGVYLIPLGMPWNRLVDAAPEPLWPWLMAAAPLINLVLLHLLHLYNARRSV